MKKIFIALIILSSAMPIMAQEYVSKYPLQTNRETKVYDNTGSLQGFVKPTSNGQYQTYNKYHQAESKYSIKTVNNGSETKVYNHSTGSLQGYTRSASNGEIRTYDRNHQYSGKFRQDGNNLKYYPKN